MVNREHSDYLISKKEKIGIFLINNNMPYIHKFTKELEQFGLCSYRLTLTDSDSILPELNIPVVFKHEEHTEEALLQLAERVIAQQTPAPTQITEEIVTVEETLIEETSLEEQI